jgi:hypothetical protein
MQGQIMARFQILALVFAMAVSSAWGAFHVEENSLRVTSPPSLQGKYESAIGNFGVPQYGGTLAGTVVYSKDQPKACEAFQDKPFKPSESSGRLPVIALVDRGGLFL